MVDETDAPASPDEAERIQEIVRSRPFPLGVRPADFDVKFGSDASGRRAAWVILKIEGDVENPSKDRVQELTKFANDLRSELLKSSLRAWPYIEFEAA